MQKGNFNLYLKGRKNKTYNHAQLTFQIGLHVDDREVLKFIQTQIHCGIITGGGDHLNFFVNDLYFIKTIIIPIFEQFGLISSKIYNFNIFKEVVLFFF
jgi:hypothetical protein